jgi:H+-transporting ATPase
MQILETFKCCKGAPRVVLAMTEKEEFGAGGHRTICVAWTEKEELGAGGHTTICVAWTDKNLKWAYNGLIPLFDPPREDTAETISGDQIAIA